jgi:hypothetical protein
MEIPCNNIDIITFVRSFFDRELLEFL